MTTHNIFATFALLAMIGAAHAARVIEQPEEGYELTLAQLALPSSASGSVTMKRCDDCAYSTHVMTATTEYYVNEQPLTYEEFKRIVDELRGDRVARETAVAGLFLAVDTGRVTRVALWHKSL
jgi:hypothetical protein